MTAEFTPFLSTLGGALIGLSASAVLLLEGRVTGISSIVGGLANLRSPLTRWRLAFIGGLVLAGLGASLFGPALVAVTTDRGTLALVAAGLLVGIGTQIGSGCTSGHGVCGLSRFSPRSLASVGTFMAVGAVVAVAIGEIGRRASS